MTTNSPPTMAPGDIAYLYWTAGAPFDSQLGSGIFTDPQGLPLTYSVAMADGSALPSWINFDPATVTFSGTVPTTYQAQNSTILDIVVTATDSAGLSSSLTYTTTVEKALPPSQSNFAPTVHVLPGSAFSARMPADIMSDPQGLAMTYWASAGDGTSPLPSWITFNPATLTFSGTVPTTVHGSYVTELHATDTAGQSGSVYFTIWLTSGPPNLSDPTPDQSWAVGQPVSLKLPSDSFTDPQGLPLTYSILGANGQQIPSWLHFDAKTLTLSGTPPNSEAGLSLGIQVTATDSEQLASSEVINVDFTSAQAPSLKAQTPAQSWATGQALSWTVPSGTFVDPGALSYSAKQADGSPLPSWLKFDPTTLTFSGTTPTAPVALSLEVDATNSAGATTGDLFTATVGHPGAAQVPELTDPTLAQGWYAGSKVTLTLAADTFTDPQGLALTYSATLTDLTSPLPSWLSFDPTTLTFSGTVPQTGASLGITVTATDSAGASASESFAVQASASSESGQIVQFAATIPSSTWKIGQAISIAVPAGTFTDPQGLALSYSGSLTDGSALPSWLSVDAKTGTITGTAPTTGESIQVRLIATDGVGYTGYDDFILNVPSPLAPELKDSVPDQNWVNGQTIKLVLPTDTFSDPQGEALTYTATQGNGSVLPSWLQFNASTLTFSGTVPSNAAPLTVTVTATDASGLTGAETIAIGVSGTTPTTSGTLTGTGGSAVLNESSISSSGVTFTANGDGSFNMSNASGTEHVSGYIQVQFSDATVTIAAHDSLGEYIAMLYQGALGRAPDPGGLAAWEQEAAALPANVQAMGAYGLADASDIAAGFVNSPEFQSKYGSLSDAQFVTQLYQNLLGRAPDTAGYAYWTAELAGGTSREHVLIGFAASAEAINLATASSGGHPGWLFLV
jgi:hypothetical protein